MIQHTSRLLVASAILALAACGKPPIEEAVGKDDRQAVARAIEEGADVNVQLDGGDTPLLLAARNGQSSSAQALIEGGADVQASEAVCNGGLH